MRWLLFLIVALPAWAQLYGPPPAPTLSPLGYQHILDYEVGGGEGYYNRFLIHPEWPKGDSGITVGVGYDCGYSSAAVIRSDWRRVDEVDRLAATAGLTGSQAAHVLASVRDMSIPWEVSEDVFKSITIAQEWSLTRRTFPGFDDLRPNAQAALVSMVFNRGSRLAGDSRVDMKRIRELVPSRDYEGMAEALEHTIETMGPTWRANGNYAGLSARYLACAKLMREP
jgi:hypothetical protein